MPAIRCRGRARHPTVGVIGTAAAMAASTVFAGGATAALAVGIRLRAATSTPSRLLGNSMQFGQRWKRFLSSRAVGDSIDTRTYELHKKYHDKTIEFTMENYEYVQNKGYNTDRELSPAQQVLIRRAARARFACWPRLEEKHTHEVQLGSSPQRFLGRNGNLVPGDPGENVFVISLARRPSKLRHVLHELYEQGISATIVDAIDGDAILCKDDVESHGVQVLPGYVGHRNHGIQLTTGEVGCFMSHYSIWHHMVEHGIESALILEDDFDFQERFAERLGEYLEEAANEDWNLLYVGRSPVEPDLRQISEHVSEPGYTLWTVGYIMRLDAARALLEAEAFRQFAPLDEFFSLAMGRITTVYNEYAPIWQRYIPCVIRGLAVSPPLVMPYVGSMFESDTAMLRSGTRYVKDLPQGISADEEERQLQGIFDR